MVDDTDLDFSWHHDLETVPTLLRVRATATSRPGSSAGTAPQWEAFTGVDRTGPRPARLAAGMRLAERRPEPQPTSWRVRFGGGVLRSRRIELAALEDEFEAMFDRGWTDGLPVVPPDRGPGAAHAGGHHPGPDEVVAVVPPDLVECTVEKVAVNAVMAGCRPEYLPVVLAAVEAACTDEFNMHGLLATTYFSGPMIMVNGPDRPAHRHEQRRQRARPGQPGQRHDRPGAAAGHAQRRWRPARRGRPGHPRATPASSASASPRTRRARRGSRSSVHRGFEPGVDTVTLFAGEGVRGRRRPALAGRRVAGPLAGRLPAHRRPTPSWCSASTPSSWSRPSTPGCSGRRAGTGTRLLEELTTLLTIDGARAGPGRRRHRRRHARGLRRDDACPSSGPAACWSSTPAAGPACSLPSSAAGSAARRAASP